MSLPIAFTFPNLGVVLLLLFIPFAGWFTGGPGVNPDAAYLVARKR